MWCNFIVLYEIIVYNIVVFKITGGKNMGAEVLIQKEINRVLNLRKIEILKKIPIVKWSKGEILDFIEHYMIYFNQCRLSDNLLSMEEFLVLGEYKQFYRTEIEEIKRK